MNRKPTRKLTLSRSTVRQLDRAKLADAAGGFFFDGRCPLPFPFPMPTPIPPFSLRAATCLPGLCV